MSRFDNATVLITGASGSLGRALVDHLLRTTTVKAIRALARSELRLAQLKQEVRDDRLRVLVGDVRDGARMTLACQGVDIVIHAAALKRLDQLAYDPAESILTNVIGSMNVAAAARTCRVSWVLGISTDKSCQNVNLYGATKALLEHYYAFANHYSGEGPTRLATCRYGNVLASNGSVLQVWAQQMAKGERLLITDERMSRFWITLPQAVRFVVQAVEEMQGGEIFVPPLPRSRVTALAKAFAPGWPVTLSGIRPGGEKLAEDLLSIHEARHTYHRGWAFVVEPELAEWSRVPPTGEPVAPDFCLTSESRPQASVDELRALLEEAGLLEQRAV